MKKIENFKKHALSINMLKHISGGSPGTVGTLGSTWHCTNASGATVYFVTAPGDQDDLFYQVDNHNENGGSIVGCESQPIG